MSTLPPQLTATLAKIKGLWGAIKTTGDVHALEDQYEALAGAAPHILEILVDRNEFRVLFSAHLKNRRPRIMAGFISEVEYPNFHLRPLFAVADIVSFTKIAAAARANTHIHYNPLTMTFQDMWAALPPSFTPDFYWEHLACAKHIPLGLDQCPVPTLGSFCHLQYAEASLNRAEAFDVLLPVSEDFGRLMRAALPHKRVEDIPFGMNWASFHGLSGAISVDDPDSLDILVPFGPQDDDAYYGMRTRVHAAMQDFAARHGDRVTVHFTEGRPKRADYFRLIKRAKIAINTCGVNGPYNYRNVEYSNCGAVTVQVTEPVFPHMVTPCREYVPGRDFLETSLDSLEADLLDLLDDPARQQALLTAAKARTEQDLTYDRGVAALAAIADSVDISARPALDDGQRVQHFLAASAHDHVFEFPSVSLQGIARLDAASPDYARMLIPVVGMMAAVLTPENWATMVKHPGISAGFSVSAADGLWACWDALDRADMVDVANLVWALGSLNVAGAVDADRLQAACRAVEKRAVDFPRGRLLAKGVIEASGLSAIQDFHMPLLIAGPDVKARSRVAARCAQTYLTAAAVIPA